MELILNTPLQHKIADALWAASSQQDLLNVINKFGAEAIAIRDLMIAQSFDEVDNLELAQAALGKFL